MTGCTKAQSFSRKACDWMIFIILCIGFVSKLEYFFESGQSWKPNLTKTPTLWWNLFIGKEQNFSHVIFGAASVLECFFTYKSEKILVPRSKVGILKIPAPSVVSFYTNQRFRKFLVASAWHTVSQIGFVFDAFGHYAKTMCLLTLDWNW